MKLEIYKMHSTGNDFIVINGFHQNIKLSTHQIKNLCHRNFGVGADGLIIIEKDAQTSFYMRYYNSDGKLGSFCGNGSRAAVFFFFDIVNIEKTFKNGQVFNFKAYDGIHYTTFFSASKIMIKFKDVNQIIKHKLGTIIDSGSPHLIIPVEDNKKVDVLKQGQKYRYSKDFIDKGINVNFITVNKDSPKTINNRTYERGVENETLSCGTGNVAAAIFQSIGKFGTFKYNIITCGGKVQVSLNSNKNSSFDNIWLSGPSKIVFKTIIDVKDL